MTREQLEHLIRAAGSITGCSELYIVGSQAVLAATRTGPDELFISREADMFVDGDPGLSELIDGTIGELSPFDQTFGYYAHGISPETATMPDGWEDRLVRLENENTGGTAGLCAEVHDLAASKLFAGREKDLTFVVGLLRSGIVSEETLRERISQLPRDAAPVMERLDRLVREEN